MFSDSYLPIFISTPSTVTRHLKTLIENIFYNKPMLNITAGNKHYYAESSDPIFD